MNVHALRTVLEVSLRCSALPYNLFRKESLQSKSIIMRVTIPQLLLATSMVPLATALQTMYFGFFGGAGAEFYFTWFSDSDPCLATDGVILNYVEVGFHCDEPFTMMGHENLTFTGCPADYPHYHTGVSDNGVPALTCEPASNPPDGPYGLFADCPYPQVNPNYYIGGVGVAEYCS